MEVDKYNVDLRNCPAPKDGYINKCGTISGEISAKAKVIFGNEPLLKNSVSCEVPTNQSVFS